MIGYRALPETLPGLREAPTRGEAAGRWFVRHHAVAAYARRVLGWSGPDEDLPETLYRRALTDLIHESARARYVKPAHPGTELWRGPKPHRLRFIVEASPRAGLPALITVLKRSDALTGDTG
jgi:hypothetical protein